MISLYIENTRDKRKKRCIKLERNEEFAYISTKISLKL